MKRTWISAIPKRTWIAVAAVVAVGLVVWAWPRGAADAQAPSAGPAGAVEMPAPADLRTEVVRSLVWPRWIEVTGATKARYEAQIGTRVMGRVLDVLVRQGDRVRKGQPLIQLDARDLEAGIVQAGANLRAAAVGADNARTVATMEAETSQARIAEARSRVAQAEAGMQAARARLDMARSGPRRQERAQASLAVASAKADLDLAASNLRRMEALVNDGAISRQQFELAQAQHEVARSRYASAVEAESMAQEGSRAEDIRAAEEAVRQAQGALQQARAGLRQAEAAALQTAVRRQEVRAADAQVGQMRASVRIARVARDYATIVAPFDGIIAERLVDPGAMAAPGVPLLKIQGGPLLLEVDVPESAMPRVRIGAAVPVRLDALGGPIAMARVVEIAPSGDPASHSFRVKLQLADARARAGMFGRARIEIGRERGLMAPREAVVEREGLTYVWTPDEAGKARLRLVTLGEEMAGGRRVLSGLADGERVLVGSLAGVRSGQQIAGGRTR